METIEARQLKQRKEAAARIWRKWPSECEVNLFKFCNRCDFYQPITWRDFRHDGQAVKGQIIGKETPQRCEHDLAPITSQQLPCPYFRTSNLQTQVHE